MTMSQKMLYSDKQEMINALAEQIELPRFTKVGESYVGNQPLKSSRSFSFGGVNFVDKESVVKSLNLYEQLHLNSKLSERTGMKIRHGSLKENLQAFYSKDTKDYKENVLYPYWVFTGEVIRRAGNSYDVSRAIGADFVKISTSKEGVLLERDGKPLGAEGSEETKLIPKMTLGPTLQTSIPTKSGYYSEFSGAIPTSEDLEDRNSKSKGYFGSIYFENNLSAVRSGWGSVDGDLDAGAGAPLFRYGGGVVGAWTDENPKK